MAEKLRRVRESQRTVTKYPAGEAIFVVDTQLVYIGDGITTGGIPVGGASSPGAGVTDHGALTGLFDNDHPQYALTSHTHQYSTITNTAHTHTDYSLTSHTHSFSAIPMYIDSKAITLRLPTASENVSLFYTRQNYMSMSADTVIVTGGTSGTVTWQLYTGSTRTSGSQLASGTTTNASDITSTNIGKTIPTNSFVWLTTSATGGSLVELSVTLQYSGA